jgi:hypothetical protein
MSLDGTVEYALTRVQSRYGNRPDASEWRRLEASHDLGQYLEAARGGIFAPWISSLDRNREAHAIERTLRGEWRDYVRSVASWHPREWQPWLTWLEWLPTLPLINRLRQPSALPAWLKADPILATVPALFEPAITNKVSPVELWLAHWRALRPPLDAFTLQLLDSVSRAVRKHGEMLVAEGADAKVLRDQLRERMQKLFRASAGTVVATLCHLLLMALDFERLRGGLVDRSLFARARAG